VISPLLSNIFLHHVLDEWFESEVRLWRVNLGETGGGDLDGMRRPIAGS
jgi:hypothetical protein